MLFLQMICICRFEQTIHLLEISDKHFHTCLSSYSFSISVPGHTKSYKEILQFGKCAVWAKLRKLEVLKHLLWLLHVFIFHSFLASFLFLTVVKIIFMPAKKCSYTYTKDEGHKYSLLMKKFLFFPVKNTLTQYETLRDIFTAP